MSKKILYFPYINIPNNSWTVKSMMYWDEVASIIPHSFIWGDETFDPFMKEILENGLITVISPDSINIDFTKLKEAITAFPDLDEKRKKFEDKENTMLINRYKFNDSFFTFLEEERLAKRETDEDYPEWFRVERATAGLMMIYLANILSEQHGFIPATDRKENMPVKFKSGQLNVARDEVRSQIITEILPYPVNPDFADLASFKEKYKEELTTFRFAVEKLVFAIAEETNKKIRKEKLEAEIHLINNEKERLIDLLKQNKFSTILKGSLWGVAIDSAAIYATGQPILLGIPTIGALVKSFFDNYEAKPLKNQSFAYLALLDQKAI